jgi:hypothetical protein
MANLNSHRLLAMFFVVFLPVSKRSLLLGLTDKNRKTCVYVAENLGVWVHQETIKSWSRWQRVFFSGWLAFYVCLELSRAHSKNTPRKACKALTKSLGRTVNGLHPLLYLPDGSITTYIKNVHEVGANDKPFINDPAYAHNLQDALPSNDTKTILHALCSERHMCSNEMEDLGEVKLG